MKLLRMVNLLVIASLTFTAVSVTPTPVLAQEEAGEYVPGEIVVGFSPGKSRATYTQEASALASKTQLKLAGVNNRGTALFRGSSSADIFQLAAAIRNQPGVLFAEPNYIYKIPRTETMSGSEEQVAKGYIIRKVKPSAETENKALVAIPKAALNSMKRTAGNSTLKAVYPNDPYLWDNNGWDWIGAGMVWTNTTASANICEIDTGVDYLHPDLKPAIIKGFDFVNADSDPMDDHGHGTHVAGIIAAVRNNTEGISGISTGKVVAVKALNSQGWGSNYNVATAINYCANRTDIRVINLSLGGYAYSAALETAIDYAVNTKGKLVVAAAGNDHVDAPLYPAFFANNSATGSAGCTPTCPTFPALTGKVLAVAASGYWYQDPPDPDPTANQYLDNSCQGSSWGQTDAYYSNFGSWISVVAPGSSIYSTTPWDKPFYLNQFYGVNTRYSWLDGTSMAAPFIAASVARRWGYHPLDTNATVGTAVITSGFEINADGTCWDTSMAGKHQVNVATLLDRGALNASAYDAETGLSLVGATVSVYQGATLKGSSVIMPDTWKADYWDPDPDRIFTGFPPSVDVINLPVGGAGYAQIPYTAKVHKTGYTASPQAAFEHNFFDTIDPGSWAFAGRATVPPKTGNFNIATSWWMYFRDDLPVTSFDQPWNLDMNVWVPNTPNPLDLGQPAPFIIGGEGDAFGYLEGDPTGTLMAFPFGILNRYGGEDYNWFRLESVTIAKRAAHGTVSANAGLPYYPGEYVLLMTDFGQTIDHNADGCGDNYGVNFDPGYDPASDPDCPPTTPAGTLGIPLLGSYFTPWAYVWKDGVIKLYVPFNGDLLPVDPNTACNTHWWKALSINSGLAGSPIYTAIDECGDVPGLEPYHATDFAGRMGIPNR